MFIFRQFFKNTPKELEEAALIDGCGFHKTYFHIMLPNAKPAILEPIYSYEIIVPDNYTGDILGDLNKRRGRILGMEMQKGLQVISAEAPLAEMLKYATELRSITQGRGRFVCEFARYEEVPFEKTQKIIAENK